MGLETTVGTVFFSAVVFLIVVVAGLVVLVVERGTVVVLLVCVETVDLEVEVEVVLRVVGELSVLLAELVEEVARVVLSPVSRFLRSFLIL